MVLTFVWVNRPGGNPLTLVAWVKNQIDVTQNLGASAASMAMSNPHDADGAKRLVWSDMLSVAASKIERLSCGDGWLFHEFRRRPRPLKWNQLSPQLLSTALAELFRLHEIHFIARHS